MGMSKNMADRLNRQMNREIYSGYLYLGMAAYADSIGKGEAANWFRGQWHEELAHADRFYKYINQQGMKVVLEAIETPPQKFLSVLDLFEKTLEHEKKVTKLIHDLVDLAKKENDKDTENFLQWFVKEQIEEEESPAKIIRQLKDKQSDQVSLQEVYAQLAKRK